MITLGRAFHKMEKQTRKSVGSGRNNNLLSAFMVMSSMNVFISNSSLILFWQNKITPLLLALKQNKEKMAEFLINNGANTKTCDFLGR